MLDLAAFDALVDSKYAESSQVRRPNYCGQCNVPMVLSHSEYQCDECGKISVRPPTLDRETTNTPHILRIASGRKKGRRYNISVEYYRTQRRVVYDQLLSNYNINEMFPIHILQAVADKYNYIQRTVVTDNIDINGIIRGVKKFVHRSSVKDEILAALLYYECIADEFVCQKRDAARFMRLQSDGFANGEDILKTLRGMKKIELPTDDFTARAYAKHYIERLAAVDAAISKEPSVAFVDEVVTASERHKVCMTSRVRSKVIGAIWLLITRRGLRITAADLEAATDHTKKNTFIKFYDTVLACPHIFKDIFIRHAVIYK